eukprot:7126777-Prymnesium_polylepis.1
MGPGRGQPDAVIAVAQTVKPYYVPPLSDTIDRACGYSCTCPRETCHITCKGAHRVPPSFVLTNGSHCC